MMKQLWKTVEELFIKVNSHSSSDPETFLLNSYLREMKNTSTKNCAHRFTKRLISKKPKPRSNSTVHPSRERMNWCVFTQWDMTHQEKGVTLLHITIVQISKTRGFVLFCLQETQKGTYCRISLVQSLKRDKTYLWSRNQDSGHL